MRSPVALLVAAALLVGGIATASADPVPPLDADPEVVPYIVGGTIVAPGTWPAMAALVQEPSPGTLQQFCGGTLIRDDLVLSAAHCTADPTFRANPRVLLGRTDLSQAGGELIDVVEIIEHPDWIGVANGFAGDLAVLRLATESVQAPTALLRPGREPSWATGTVPGTIVGWGQLEGGASDPNLREVSVTVRTDVDCEASIPTYQTGLDLCAGGADFGACFGDSGGPLYSFDASGRSVIAGVVSRGLQTCAQAPGILTRVAAFAEWVVTASLSDATARIAGADRYATAANLADRYAPGVPSVHLVSGEAFPDAVTAAAAAGRAGGPVLLTRQGSLPEPTRAALARLRPARLVVVGGPAAVSGPVVAAAGAAAGVTPERIGGTDRYATAAALAAVTHPTGADTVFVTVGTAFADAVASGPVAAATSGGPVLLTETGRLPDPTAAALASLAPSRVVILGGTSAVGAAVTAEIEAITGVVAERVRGDDRYATAATLSALTFSSGATTVYVATGRSFADALAAGPVAALDGAPILLVDGDEVPTTVLDELARLGADRVVVLGGPAAVGHHAAWTVDGAR